MTDESICQTTAGCSARLISILHDAYRFGLAFIEEIALGPDAVYTSALSFCPQNTAIYETYGKLVEGRVRYYKV